MSKFFPSELIKAKRRGQTHTKEELEFLIQSYTRGELPDYQMSAWLMAVFFQGMTSEETALLTEQMLLSGSQLDFSDLPTPAVDKHSTGGVGDKTSLMLAPLVAAAGVFVPMIAGRGLGHTGGTLDKLEAIPGFSVNLGLREFAEQVRTVGAAIIGQTAEICPADKKIYALRDVTATVESLPLICASIMSKKLAEGIRGLVLDVKFGSGAFMKTVEDATALATGLIEIGKHRGVKVRALLTNMNQPLGRYVGNALEVEECLQILRQESTDICALNDLHDCQEVTLRLAGEMIWLGDKASDPEEGYAMAVDILKSGQALTAFEAMVARQGGDLKSLPKAQFRRTWKAPQAGYIKAVDVEKMGLAAIELGAGRLKVTDTIDPVAGLFVHRKPGDKVEAGDPIVTMFASSEKHFDSAEKTLAAAHEFSLNSVPQRELIERVLGAV
jgi:pyrimidine-nucleoside phosphorylase